MREYSFNRKVFERVLRRQDKRRRAKAQSFNLSMHTFPRNDDDNEKAPYAVYGAVYKKLYFLV